MHFGQKNIFRPRHGKKLNLYIFRKYFYQDLFQKIDTVVNLSMRILVVHLLSETT